MAAETNGVSMDAQVWAAVREWAKQEGRSLSNAVERLITLALKDQKEK